MQYPWLRHRWETVWQRLAAPGISYDVLDELIRAYSSPDRYYHNLTHIQDCLSIFDRTSSLAAHPEEVELGIWFHDAVYDSRRNDNEKKSADWAEAVNRQSSLGNEIAGRVTDCILATRHEAEAGDHPLGAVVDGVRRERQREQRGNAGSENRLAVCH